MEATLVPYIQKDSKYLWLEYHVQNNEDDTVHRCLKWSSAFKRKLFFCNWMLKADGFCVHTHWLPFDGVSNLLLRVFKVQHSMLDTCLAGQ